MNIRTSPVELHAVDRATLGHVYPPPHNQLTKRLVDADL